MKIGYNVLTLMPITVDIGITGHVCIVGGTGTGKSICTLYLLYNLAKNYEVKLWICDFKKTGDYVGISDQCAEYVDVTRCIEEFYTEFVNTPENNSQIKVLLIDEYAGYLIWLSQRNKRKAEEIKQLVSEILMLGRSRRCFVWCVQQRISAALFPASIGAIDNFQICIGLGRLSVESRKSLFAGEHLGNVAFEEAYHPKTGQGLVLIDGQELQPLQVPYISDKERLKLMMRKIQNGKEIFGKKGVD